MIVAGESERQGMCEMQKKREKVNEKLDVPGSSWSQVRWVSEVKRDIQIKTVHIPGKIIIS